MSSRFQVVVAIVLALSVFAILVSPFVASQLTTLKSTQKVRPPAVVLPLDLYVALTSWLTAPSHAGWDVVAQLVLPGSERLALTCARIC